MCIENTHFKCLKKYYRDLRVEITHLLLECRLDLPQNVSRNLLLARSFFLQHFPLFFVA